MKHLLCPLFLTLISLTTFADINDFRSLKNHKVTKVVMGRWQGVETNVVLPNKTNYVARDFRIGADSTGTRLVFESMIKSDDYLAYFNYYNEDCLEYDEYGYIQHLCIDPSGYVEWEGPCAAGSYKTRMTRSKQNGQDVIIKNGDHWDHEGHLHRKNSGTFKKID